MKLTILGTCGAFAEKNRACSGYLIQMGGTSIVVDLGPGTLANLQNHIDVSDIDSIIFSHMHPDHFTDIYSLRYLMEFIIKPDKPLDLWGVQGFEDNILRLLPDAEDTFRRLFSFNVINDDFAVGAINIGVSKGIHPVENNMMRFTEGGKSITYTGDTGSNDRIAAIAKDSDILLTECTFLSDGPDPRTHLRAADSAHIAVEANVQSLILTHFWPGLDRMQAGKEAAAIFKGNIAIANENNVFLS